MIVLSYIYFPSRALQMNYFTSGVLLLDTLLRAELDEITKSSICIKVIYFTEQLDGNQQAFSQ